MAKLLIINADDFGLTNSINSGIIKAFEEGTVASASLIVTGSAFDNAKELIRIFPDLDIGLHLTLTDEKPVLKPEYIKSLVDKNGNCLSLSNFLLKYFTGRINKGELELEIKAQFQKAINSGIKITHLDSHNHIHILGYILGIVIRLCKEFDIKYIRLPDERISPEYILSGFSLKRFLSLCIIKILAINTRNKIKGAGLKSTRFFFGFLNSGNLKIGNIKKIITSLKDGISELMVHPGKLNNELAARYGNWNYNWEGELNLLTQQTTKILFKRSSITKGNFKNLY